MQVSSLETQWSRVWSTLRAARGSRWGSAIALFDQGIVSIVNFATGVIVGRACGKTALGIYTLAWSIVMVTDIFGSALITTPYTVFSPRWSRGERGRHLGSALVHQVLLSIAVALLMAAGTLIGAWRGNLSANIVRAALTAAGVIVFLNLREFVRRISLADLRVGLIMLVDIGACFAQIVGVLLLFHFSALTVSRVYILLGVASAVAAAGWLTLYSRDVRLDGRSFAKDLARNWKFANWILISMLLWAFCTYLYPWMLAFVWGISITGTWAACSAIAAAVSPVLQGLGNYAGPKISHIYASSGAAVMQRYVYRSSLLLAAAVLPLVIILVGFGERIVVAVYGSAYSGTANVIALLAFNMLIMAATFPYSRALITLHCAKHDSLINVVAVVLLFAIGIASVKSYAALGAAASLLAATAVTGVIKVAVFARQVRLSASLLNASAISATK